MVLIKNCPFFLDFLLKNSYFLNKNRYYYEQKGKANYRQEENWNHQH